MKKVAWTKLKTHRGKGAGLLQRLKAYAANEDSLMAYLELSEHLVHDSKWAGGVADDDRWVEASAPAIAWLLEHTPEARYPARMLALVAELAGAPHERAWLMAREASLPTPIVDALHDGWATLEAAAADNDAAVRAATAMVLAMVGPSDAEPARGLLRPLVDEDASSAVRASALLALARFATSEDEQRIDDAAARDGDALVGGAAALAKWRLDPSRPLADLGDGLARWLSLPPRGDADEPLCWFHSDVGGPNRPHAAQGVANSAWAVHVLAHLTDSWPAWCDTVVALGCRSDSSRVRRSVSDLLWLNELPSGPGYRLLAPEAFSDRQRDLLERIGDRWLCMLPRGGMPAAGSPRMRYFGWMAPSFMERLVEVEIDGETVQRTLGWTRGKPGHEEDGRWVYEHDDRYLPEVEALAPALRWRVLAEMSLFMSALNGFRIYDGELDRLVARAVEDPKLEELATPLLDEVAAWYAEAQAQGLVGKMDPEWADLLLVAPARAGIPFKEGWEVLFPEDLPKQHGRAIVACMAPERRDAWLSANPQYLSRVASYVDLVATEPRLRGYWSKIAKMKSARKGAKVAVIEKRMRELAETVPLFAETMPASLREG